MGSPKGRESYGDGVPAVIGGVTSRPSSPTSGPSWPAPSETSWSTGSSRGAVNSARARRALRSTTSASSQTSTSQDDGRNPPGCTSWPSDGARPWSSAAAATRTSTLAGQPRPTRNDHWRAGCEETPTASPVREETDGKGPGQGHLAGGRHSEGGCPEKVRIPIRRDTGPRRAAHPTDACVPILQSSGRAGGRRWILRATTHGCMTGSACFTH